MHSNPRHQFSLFSLNWQPANLALTAVVALIFLIFILLLLTLMEQVAQSQNSIPPTARQAATMPQFAARLHPASQNASRLPHRYQPQASYKHPQDMRQPGLLPADDVVYTNGPINGTTDAWTINFGFIVSNTFPVPSTGATLTSLSFGAWLAPGDVLQTVEVSITDSEFGGTTYFDGVINFTQSGCIGNQDGFNGCTESGALSVNTLAQGTYWINLQNATVNTGDPVYWDENSGPSLASENSVGTIPSEAFTLLGAATTTTCDEEYCPPECVHDRGLLKVIHNFSDSSPNPDLALDDYGNVYGTTGGGGGYGLGQAFDLVSRGGNWMFTSLYSFLGGAHGQNPSSEVIGPDRALYGAGNGGLQQCGSSQNQYCGVVYRLRPSPFVCFTALCSWNETVIYQFTGDPDGWRPNGNLIMDQAGNLYGTTTSGGALGKGTIFQLTPSGGGWTEKVIHSFSGGNEGGQPTSLLLGEDGNLYGTTGSNYVDSGGVIFKLTRSGDSWSEQILARFSGCGQHEGSCAPRLTQEYSGNFYGVYEYGALVGFPEYWGFLGRIFEMSPSGHFTILDDSYGRIGGCCAAVDLFDAVVVDSAGNIYATEVHSNFLQNRYGVVFKLLSNGEEQGLAAVSWDYFSDRDLEVDASGNLYGTTGTDRSCNGTVWQVTPP